MSDLQRTERIRVIVDALRHKHSILIATHIFPDADAIGSQLGLGNILESIGKKVFYFSDNGCPHLHDFFPNCHKLNPAIPSRAECDVAVALDCGDQFRLGPQMERLLEIRPFLVIDHHEGHKEFGDISWVDPFRSSTGEMVYELALALGAPVSLEAAYSLYAAIVSDTGSFKYSSTSADTFRIAGELVARGVRPSEVAGKLFDNFSPARLALLQEVLATLELYSSDRIGVINVSRDIFAKTATTPEDTEDFISYPRALRSVQVAVFIKEASETLISVSLRSKGKRDVASIARKFGGGGHRNAAGFRLQGFSIAEIRQKLLPEIMPILT